MFQKHAACITRLDRGAVGDVEALKGQPAGVARRRRQRAQLGERRRAELNWRCFVTEEAREKKIERVCECAD